MDDILTARNILESASNPKITYGGQSSSSTLNKINENLRSDLLAIDAEVASVESELSKNRALLSCQATAIGQQLSHIAADLDYIRVNLTTSVRVDIYDGRYVDTDNTTAETDTEFGQATLTTTGSSDWLTATDLDGNTWIPTNTSIRYTTSSDGHYPNSGNSLDEFIEDSEFVYALDGDPGTMWVQEKTADYVWIEIQVPMDVSTNNLANTILLRPFPVFCHDLELIEITSQAGSIMNITPEKLSYLPGYDSVGNTISRIADVRVFFPPTQVSSVRIKLKAGPFPYWGFSHIGLQTTTFKAESTLVLDTTAIKPVGKSISTITLRGDNESLLAQITPSINGAYVTYTLAQQAAGHTPVITAADITWA